MGTISQKIAKSYIANPKLLGPAEGRGVCAEIRKRLRPTQPQTDDVTTTSSGAPTTPPETCGGRSLAHLPSNATDPHAAPDRPAASCAAATAPQLGERPGQGPTAGRPHQPE